MTRFRIHPYKQGSASAKALADALGGKVLKLQGSLYIYKDTDTIINWGSSSVAGVYSNYCLNSGLSVSSVSNKRLFFQLMAQENQDVIPKFWTNRQDIGADQFPVVCRTILNGHSGAGIVIADDVESLVDAQLYTQYVKKHSEFRIHVGKKQSGEIVSISEQRKVRKPGVDVTDWRVRNLDNGFIFQRDGIEVPVEVRDAAYRTLTVTGLDFGAVDVIWNANSGKAYVLEVNTACGLDQRSADDYAKFFKERTP